MSSNTSIGRGPAHGSNENHDADPTHKTLGEADTDQDAPSGADDVLDQAAPDLPAGVRGGRAEPGVRKAGSNYPDGPNVESSPWELEAARGHVPKEK